MSREYECNSTGLNGQHSALVHYRVCRANATTHLSESPRTSNQTLEKFQPYRLKFAWFAQDQWHRCRPCCEKVICEVAGNSVRKAIKYEARDELEMEGKYRIKCGWSVEFDVFSNAPILHKSNPGCGKAQRYIARMSDRGTMAGMRNAIGQTVTLSQTLQLTGAGTASRCFLWPVVALAGMNFPRDMIPGFGHKLIRNHPETNALGSSTPGIP